MQTPSAATTTRTTCKTTTTMAYCCHSSSWLRRQSLEPSRCELGATGLSLLCILLESIKHRKLCRPTSIFRTFKYESKRGNRSCPPAAVFAEGQGLLWRPSCGTGPGMQRTLVQEPVPSERSKCWTAHGVGQAAPTALTTGRKACGNKFAWRSAQRKTARELPTVLDDLGKPAANTKSGLQVRTAGGRRKY